MLAHYHPRATNHVDRKQTTLANRFSLQLRCCNSIWSRLCFDLEWWFCSGTMLRRVSGPRRQITQVQLSTAVQWGRLELALACSKRRRWPWMVPRLAQLGEKLNIQWLCCDLLPHGWHLCSHLADDISNQSFWSSRSKIYKRQLLWNGHTTRVDP